MRNLGLIMAEGMIADVLRDARVGIWIMQRHGAACVKEGAMMKKSMKFALVAVAMTVTGSAASAATCSAGGVTFSLVQGTVMENHVLDSFCTTGNDTNTILPGYELFGLTGWNLGDKTDGPDGDGKVFFTTFDNFNWELSNPEGFEFVVLTLKQANAFGAFLLDTTKTLAGTWFTDGPGGSEGDISHASSYYNGEPGVIPLPAAGWLLLAGVGGLAAMRRRKKAA